jgi:uroporphyrinogen decarboxylase
MTPRERVLASLDHREPDCVPIDCGATMCSTLTLVAEEKLKEHLGLRISGEAITNALTESVDLPEEIQVRYGVDFRTVRMKGPGPAPEAPAGQPARTAPGHEITDEFGTVWRKTWHDYVPMVFSYAEATLSTLDRMPMPDPYDPGRVMGVREEARKLREGTDYAIVCDFTCGGPFEQAQRIRGFEQFMVDIAQDRPFAAALMERLTDNAIGFWDAMLAEVGDCVDVVCQGDDLGMQTGLQISEADYRMLVKPCHRRLFDFIHSRTAAKVWLHSCGAVSSIIPDLAEVGVDALNPVQTSAAGMALARLKRDFGRDITFWGGGIDIQRLPSLTLAEIRDEVARAIEIMAPGGGYVFAASHNILPETSGEKTDAAYLAAVEKRKGKRGG